MLGVLSIGENSVRAALPVDMLNDLFSFMQTKRLGACGRIRLRLDYFAPLVIINKHVQLI